MPEEAEEGLSLLSSFIHSSFFTFLLLLKLSIDWFFLIPAKTHIYVLTSQQTNLGSKF